MQGLLFYDPTVGEGEFYTSNGQGGIARTRLHIGWRGGWTRIVPGNFGGDGFADLLFYEPSTGTGEFYRTDARGRIRLLARHTGWRSSWTHIIPGNFGGSGFTDLLFYDAAAGTGEFYATNGQGGITQLAMHTNWRTSWSQIVPGSFGGNGFTDLLFYEAGSGTGEFYATNGRGGISRLALHTNWRSSWTQIVPGNFGGNGFTDLLFYSAPTGTGEFYTTNGQGGISFLRSYTDWRRSWSQIVPGEFASESLCLRLHFKTLIPITPALNAFLDRQCADMFQLFARSGITVVRGADEDLSGDPALAPLQNLDVGDCRGDTTQDQRDLYANRNNAGHKDIVVYVVASLISTRGNILGCASHPDGRPGAVIIPASARWLTAHEVGHVLDLNHACKLVTPEAPNPSNPCVPGSGQSDRLMFPIASWTNVPPDITTAEENTMRNSGLTNRCQESTHADDP